MNGFYYALDIIKNQLELDNDVNVVNTGIIEDVLLKKKDIYPYSHILVNNATLNGSTWSVSYSVICMDIVDISKEQTTDIFRGQNNVQDVLNTQFVVINRVLEVLRRGENTHLYQLDGSPNCEPFEDRFEHGVAGWTVTFDLLIPNDMTVCATDVAPVKLCPDFEYTITDADSTVLYTGDILSGNSLVQLISNATVTNSLSTVLATILAQGTIELADVDNIDSDGLTVPTPAGVAFTCTPQIVCADATYSIEDSALNVLYSGSIVSGGNLNQTITDGSIVLQDTASTIISTTPIEAQGTEIVTAPDSSYNVEYLDGSPIESGSIVSGGSKLVQVANPIVCADATVHNTDNSYTASVPSGGDLELVNEVITITDENDNVLQTISFPVYENQTIELSSFCIPDCPITCETQHTGQTTSYTTYDDGDLEEGAGVDFFTLSENNPYGNTLRWTGTTGTSTIQADGIMLDWGNRPSGNVYTWYTTPYNGVNFNSDIANAHGYTIGGLSTWFLPNKNQLNTLMNSEYLVSTNWAPLNVTSIVLRSSTTDPNNTGNCIVIIPSTHSVQPENKLYGSPRQYLAFRITTLAELGL